MPVKNVASAEQLNRYLKACEAAGKKPIITCASFDENIIDEFSEELEELAREKGPVAVAEADAKRHKEWTKQYKKSRRESNKR